MKNLQLINMLLVSHREKKAKKIVFDPQVTIIKGINDTGKSSVIKSIQYVFGANPHKRHPKWKEADISILLRFSLDNVEYSIYRHRDSFTLFDARDMKIGTYSSITLELAPALAKLFNFNLKLLDREGSSIVPPPAYLMLPFYIDQDGGWTNTWNSFTNLSQFSHWKERVSGYHFGIKPDKWYELEAKKKNKEAEKDDPYRQINAIQSVRGKAYQDMSRTDFDIDIDQFRKEITELLERCNVLKDIEVKYRNKISELKTEKIRLDAQIEIVVRTHDELSDDYKYSCEIKEDEVGCPTCGANYHNSFSERFDIAKDTETCTDLLASLREDLNEVSKQIDDTHNALSEVRKNSEHINNILSEKRGEVKLKDLIDIEGKKSLLKHLDNEIILYKEEINKIEGEVQKFKDEMDKLDDPNRRKSIVSEYGENLRKNTMSLSVFSLSDNVFKNTNPSIEESGSDLPRAILAYFFAALTAIEKNGNATYFPMVIDAPNQQEQDQNNLKKMLNFIINNRPNGKQLILGLVEDAGIDFKGKVITFDKKYSVLSEDDYHDVSNEIKHFETINLAISN